VARPFLRRRLSIGNYKHRAARVWNSSLNPSHMHITSTFGVLAWLCTKHHLSLTYWHMYTLGIQRTIILTGQVGLPIRATKTVSPWRYCMVCLAWSDFELQKCRGKHQILTVELWELIVTQKGCKAQQTYSHQLKITQTGIRLAWLHHIIQHLIGEWTQRRFLTAGRANTRQSPE